MLDTVSIRVAFQILKEILHVSKFKNANIYHIHIQNKVLV